MEEVVQKHDINQVTDLFAISLNSNWEFTLKLDAQAVVVIVLIVLVFLALVKAWNTSSRNKGASFEIDSAEIGFGDQKIILKPNEIDRQIAYKIWVELSTRKIGLPIDLDHDVIIEIYDSWYSFFAVVRELVKDVPVSKYKRSDSQKIVQLSIDVLNSGIRPHLTKWQARYRKWHSIVEKKNEYIKLEPQDLQKEFPNYEDLVNDLKQVNHVLIAYKERMRDLVLF